jgi:hypothetical protein
VTARRERDVALGTATATVPAFRTLGCHGRTLARAFPRWSGSGRGWSRTEGNHGDQGRQAHDASAPADVETPASKSGRRDPATSVIDQGGLPHAKVPATPPANVVVGAAAAVVDKVRDKVTRRK